MLQELRDHNNQSSERNRRTGLLHQELRLNNGDIKNHKQSLRNPKLAFDENSSRILREMEFCDSENRPLNSNSLRSRSRNTSQNRSQEILFILNLDIGKKIKDKITFKRGDIPEDLAIQFCQKNSLNIKVYDLIVQGLRDKYEEAIKMESEEDQLESSTLRHHRRQFQENNQSEENELKELSYDKENIPSALRDQDSTSRNRVQSTSLNKSSQNWRRPEMSQSPYFQAPKRGFLIHHQESSMNTKGDGLNSGVIYKDSDEYEDQSIEYFSKSRNDKSNLLTYSHRRSPGQGGFSFDKDSSSGRVKNLRDLDRTDWNSRMQSRRDPTSTRHQRIVFNTDCIGGATFGAESTENELRYISGDQSDQPNQASSSQREFIFQQKEKPELIKYQENFETYCEEPTNLNKIINASRRETLDETCKNTKNRETHPTQVISEEQYRERRAAHPLVEKLKPLKASSIIKNQDDEVSLNQSSVSRRSKNYFVKSRSNFAYTNSESSKRRSGFFRDLMRGSFSSNQNRTVEEEAARISHQPHSKQNDVRISKAINQSSSCLLSKSFFKEKHEKRRRSIANSLSQSFEVLNKIKGRKARKRSIKSKNKNSRKQEPLQASLSEMNQTISGLNKKVIAPKPKPSLRTSQMRKHTSSLYGSLSQNLRARPRQSRHTNHPIVEKEPIDRIQKREKEDPKKASMMLFPSSSISSTLGSKLFKNHSFFQMSSERSNGQEKKGTSQDGIKRSYLLYLKGLRNYEKLKRLRQEKCRSKEAAEITRDHTFIPEINKNSRHLANRQLFSDTGSSSKKSKRLAKNIYHRLNEKAEIMEARKRSRAKQKRQKDKARFQFKPKTNEM